MHCRLSCRHSWFPGEATRDHDQHYEHGDAGNEEITQNSGLAIHIAEEDRTDADISVDGGVGDEGKLPARDAPGERCATGGEESEKPHGVALRIEDPGQQRPKENVGRDIQIGAEEMWFQAAALEYGPGGAYGQAVENRILPVLGVPLCILVWRPVRNGESEPSGQRRQRERQHQAVVETIGEEEEEARGRQQIEIPLSGEYVKPVFKVSERHTPGE